MTLGEIRALIKSLVGLHGGHAEANAIMFEERRPARELRPFVHIYGMQPAMIREIGRSRFLCNGVLVADTCFMIASKGYEGTMKVLDTVGGFHLLNYFLKRSRRSLIKSRIW